LESVQLTSGIIEAAMKVHTYLGPGLLESVYQKCLVYELRKRGIEVESEAWLPVIYDELRVEGAFKADLIVNDVVVVELKAVEQILAVHKAQLLSYLRLTGKPVGLLLNFNVAHLREGICRFTNRHRLSPAAKR
jgi:GxxExxY protein